MRFLSKPAITITFAISFFMAHSAYANESERNINIHNIQAKRLMTPSSIQSKYEKKGKVYMYIGMKDKEVDRALDAEFDRIENFMFVSVVKTDKNAKSLRNKSGELILESDDC